MNDFNLEKMVKRILQEEFGISSQNGVFIDVQEAVSSALNAFRSYSALLLRDRERLIQAIRDELRPLVPELARLCVEETGMGNAEDKIRKINLAIDKTPGVEDLVTEVRTGDDGLTLYELSAWGVACAVHPRTNPCATLINNTIGLLAAGNAAIHIPHPRALGVTQLLVRAIDDVVRRTCGIRDLVSTVYESSMAAAFEVMSHPDVSLVVATGGAEVLRRAMTCGKKVVGAGPANPVAIVDETADVEKAAADIVEGAVFDNNILCISEKSVVVVDSIADRLIRAMTRRGAVLLEKLEDVLALTAATVTDDRAPNKALEGKSAVEILAAAGLSHMGTPRLLLVETEAHHPFVMLEMSMPVLPLVRVRNFEAAMETAMEIEQGLRHTAVLHSQSIERLSEAAKTMQTAVFVKNGSSLAAIGMSGQGSTSFTIATATGEGTTTARHFARRRRCILTDTFSIR